FLRNWAILVNLYVLLSHLRRVQDLSIIYLNGHEIGSNTADTPYQGSGNLRLGSGLGGDYKFSGRLANVRIWKRVRTADEINATMHQQFTGQETDLVACWPLSKLENNGTTTPDLTGNHPGTINGTLVSGFYDALVSSEYSTITVDPVTQRKSAMMRRFFACPTLYGIELLPEKRIEQLQLQWIGNGQFAPTLLGYIEGAPPIPSENLTENNDYNGATSVELDVSEDMEFSWNRSQEDVLGASFEGFIGSDTEGYGGQFALRKTDKFRGGYKGSLDFSYQFIEESSITSSASNLMSDSLELRGSPEQTVKFSHLGTRFIPKNVGYALVVSSLTDIFITKLSRTGRMVGYQVQPIKAIPPDVNTITFLINPAYTMNGSLDGMTGSYATSDRFFRHVPEMRSQFGSLYPASYYRLKEAYDLKQAIEREDKRRESYFEQFDVRYFGLQSEKSLEQEIDGGDVPESISVQREEDQFDTNMTDDERNAAEEEKAKKIKEEMKAAQGGNKDEVKAKQVEIQNRIDDEDKKAHASESFDNWQKKMENISIRAGKHNIVNTYVWDADGGLRSEVQSFANTAEHTIGGSFDLSASLGADVVVGVGSGQVELTALANINLTQTITKTQSHSRGIELNVDLSGVESIGITDYNDYPIMPGEKVDRYRFMSFYLEGSNDNFYDFFNYVVDPEWLRSNDEEARALRQTMAGKANKTWRVLHRVTYVERPALMGFGHDTRNLVGSSDEITQRLYSKIEKLEEDNRNLNRKIDALFELTKNIGQSLNGGS
ncbi:LamG-like jellyroll fold domain-containing protein, partial [Leptothoe spongobia]